MNIKHHNTCMNDTILKQKHTPTSKMMVNVAAILIFLLIYDASFEPCEKNCNLKILYGAIFFLFE